MSKIALDTNILIYSHNHTDLYKQNIARDLILQSPIIPAQVVSEYINVLRRMPAIPKDKVLWLCAKTLENVQIHPVDVQEIKLAEQLMLRYHLQIFDSIIVASSITSGCEILYSEDMQHNFIVDGKLIIINPFISMQ
jgi:predicted nucleic acid-binding protein